MDLWSLKKNGYNKDTVVEDGNRFLIANGYMGFRGTLDEAGSSAFPAVNLAGVYDRYENLWREPVNAPNGLFTAVFHNGEAMSPMNIEPVSHSIGISYRHGIFSRESVFTQLVFRSERIASVSEPHLLASRVSIEVSKPGTIELRTGISTDIWDINGPHLFDFRLSCNNGSLLCESTSGEKKIPVAVSQCIRSDIVCSEHIEENENGIFRVLCFNGEPGSKYELEIFSAVYTGLDTAQPAEAALRLAALSAGQGYEVCRTGNNDTWERIWESSAVELEGCEEAARALHASQYYLNSIAPRHNGRLSIPARGLSGQTYKGAVFWDSEIFLFPMFVYTQPEIARSLIRYRIDTLPGALKKAAEYGYRGAFYAWESQEGGEEGCTDFNVIDVFTHRPVRTYFRDKQIHISADIAYTIRQYYDITGDRSLLEGGGAEVIMQCARFFVSRCSMHLDSHDADLCDVIGPDEYHERVTNNAFTNKMVLNCLESALELKVIFSDKPEYISALSDRLCFEVDWQRIESLCAKLRKPRTVNGVIEQFDGYFGLEDCSLDTVRSRLCDPREYWGGDHGVAGTTRIIKQADVIAMLALFPECFSDESVAMNWHFYESRTEHGSSLSACMYALTACRIHENEKAWQLFMKSACVDISGSSKQWAGEIYIGGTHPASNGGAWMIAVLGFAGLRVRNGVIELHPNLPDHISSIRFPITVNGMDYRVCVTRDKAELISVK